MWTMWMRMGLSGLLIYRRTPDHYGSPHNFISALNHPDTLTTQVGVWLNGLQSKQKSIWEHPDQVIKVTIKSVITASSCSSWEDSDPQEINLLVLLCNLNPLWNLCENMMFCSAEQSSTVYALLDVSVNDSSESFVLPFFKLLKTLAFM